MSTSTETISMANLERGIGPVPKEKRTYFARNPEFEQWIGEMPAWQMKETYLGQNQENQEAYGRLMHLLIKRTDAIHEILAHMENEHIPDEAANRDLIVNFPNHLQYWLSSIGEEIDGMLGCSAEYPEIYFEKNLVGCAAIYNSNKRSIGISNRISGESAAFNIGHEYCHHLQDHAQAPRAWFLCKIIAEGFADCIAMNAAKSYAEKNGDTSVYLSGQGRFWRNIKYFCLRLEKGETPESDNKFYAAGGTALILAEAMHGKQIHREIIRSQEPLEFMLQKLR